MLWQFMVCGEVYPVFLSMFGDWYLRRPDGTTDELSVIEGTLQTIASTAKEFEAKVNDTRWQEDHLLSNQVWQLHDRGLVPKVGQCYALAPHPVFTGNIDVLHAIIMDIEVWQNICVQVFSRKNGNEA